MQALDPAQPSRLLTLRQGLTDRVTSVAWHPTRRNLFAFGCDTGAVGTADAASGIATAFTIRHKACGPTDNLSPSNAAYCRPPRNTSLSHRAEAYSDIVYVRT